MVLPRSALLRWPFVVAIARNNRHIGSSSASAISFTRCPCGGERAVLRSSLCFPSANQLQQPYLVSQVATSHYVTLTSALSFAEDGSAKRKGELTYEDIQALISADNIQLYDVREPKELIEYGKIPKAVNIPLGELKEALLMSDEAFVEHYKCSKPQKHDMNVVFYGLGPIKSTAALEIACKLGFKKARNYVGGWEDYARHAGLPLKKNQQ